MICTERMLKMSNIFMSTENNKRKDPNRFRIYFTDKIDVRENKKNSFIRFINSLHLA